MPGMQDVLAQRNAKRINAPLRSVPEAQPITPAAGWLDKVNQWVQKNVRYGNVDPQRAASEIPTAQGYPMGFTSTPGNPDVGEANRYFSSRAAVENGLGPIPLATNLIHELALAPAYNALADTVNEYAPGTLDLAEQGGIQGNYGTKEMYRRLAAGVEGAADSQPSDLSGTFTKMLAQKMRDVSNWAGTSPDALGWRQ